MACRLSAALAEQGTGPLMRQLAACGVGNEGVSESVRWGQAFGSSWIRAQRIIARIFAQQVAIIESRKQLEQIEES